jgi:hypothetical protein
VTDLFGHEPEPKALARIGDPDTSWEAANDISPSIRKLQADVLAYAAECGRSGFIDPEMNRHFGTHLSTYRTRRAELVVVGLIEDTGDRVALNPDGKGRKHAVWRITDRGKAEHLRRGLNALGQAA